jgi:hypothetical protein
MRALLTAVLLLAGCEDVNHVTLAFVDRSPTPFSCLDAAGEPLVLRAASDRRVAIVVDFLALPRLPFCAVTELVRICGADDACPVVDRSCFEIEVGPEVSTEAEIIGAVSEALAALPEPITRDAPEGPVLVRAVVTTDRCDAVGDELVESTLVACGVTCPVVLADYHGLLELDLPSLRRSCTIDEVAICAGTR